MLGEATALGEGPQAGCVNREPLEGPPGQDWWLEKCGRSWPWGQRVHTRVLVCASVSVV